MNNIWNVWKPAPDLHSHYNFVESIADEGLIVLLSNNDHKVRLDFGGFIIFGHRRIHRDLSIAQPKDNWSFYTTENSDFMDWLLKQDGSIHAHDTRMQFSMFTNQCVIDVVIADRDSVTVEVILK